MVKTDDGPAIEVRDLVRAYRGRGGELIKANDGLTFNVPRGQVFGLFGANGAGKTTLVLQMLGLVRPTSGSITVNGIDVVRHPELVKSTVGFLPQRGLSMRLIEARRALHYTGRLRGQSEADARRQTDELIEELGLGPYADRQVERLSGGLMRLVNFGMTLMGRPELIVLDEPTNELDPHNRRLIWDIVQRRAADDGTTIVLVTHNVLEAEKAVHRVAVMHGGRITAMGTPGELKEQTGAQARLELFVRDGGSLTEAEAARLGRIGVVTPGDRNGSYLVTAPPDRIQPLLEVLVTDVGVTRVDDFRFARPTLEDVYLSLKPEPVGPPEEPAEPEPEATRSPEPQPPVKELAAVGAPGAEPDAAAPATNAVPTRRTSRPSWPPSASGGTPASPSATPSTRRSWSRCWTTSDRPWPDWSSTRPGSRSHRPSPAGSPGPRSCARRSTGCATPARPCGSPTRWTPCARRAPAPSWRPARPACSAAWSWPTGHGTASPPRCCAATGARRRP
ncbi:ATP-binding cassette domain-containing protein [Streptomyces sp. uw30]|nr:ATP-binding cassette domain-containing protein [Streptomyces sp. uw30]